MNKLKMHFHSNFARFSTHCFVNSHRESYRSALCNPRAKTAMQRRAEREKDRQLVRGQQEEREECRARNRKSNANLNASSDAPNDFKSQRVITQTDARCVQSGLSPVQFGTQSEEKEEERWRERQRKIWSKADTGNSANVVPNWGQSAVPLMLFPLPSLCLFLFHTLSFACCPLVFVSVLPLWLLCHMSSLNKRLAALWTQRVGEGKREGGRKMCLHWNW